MADTISHQVSVRDKPAFLHRMMVELAGKSHISLEGDLSQCRFDDKGEDLSPNETAILKRSTLWPKQEFVVLRLTSDKVNPIFNAIMRAGLKRAIIHIQIERNGVLELAAYDNFHPECVVTGPGINRTLLEELKSSEVIAGFGAAGYGRSK